MVDVVPTRQNTTPPPSSTSFGGNLRNSVLHLNQTDTKITNLHEMLESMVASEFHEHQDGYIQVLDDTSTVSKRFTVSLNQPPEKRTNNSAIYLTDIAQLLDEAITWLKEPQRGFDAFADILQALNDPELNRYRPATRYGLNDPSAPENTPLSYPLLMANRLPVYGIATKLLAITRAISDRLNPQQKLKTKQLTSLNASIEQSISFEALRAVWPQVLQLATSFATVAPEELFFSTELAQQPVSVIEAKMLFNAFTLKFNAIPRGILFLVDEKKALRKLELAQKFPEDQTIITAFTVFFTQVFADPDIAEATQNQNAQPLGALLKEETVTQEEAIEELSNAAATSSEITANPPTPDINQITTPVDENAPKQTGLATPTRTTAAPSTSTTITIEETSAQLRNTAAWIQGVAIGQLFANTSVDIEKIPDEIKVAILNESMVLLAGLSANDLRNPAIRHQVFDKLILQIKQNAALNAQLQVLYTGFSSATNDPSEGKKIVDELEKRARVATENEEQRQQLTTELDKQLEPLAETKAAFPANFEKEMSALTDFNQQGIGPNTSGYKQIVTTIDQLIFIKEAPPFLEILTPDEFNQLFGVNLTSQQIAVLKPKLEGYWLMRAGQLEQVFQLPTITQDLPTLLLEGENALSPAAKNYRVRARFRQIEQLRNPNLPLGQHFDPQDLIVAAAANKVQHRRLVFSHYLKLSPAQVSLAMSSDDADLPKVLSDVQLETLKYHERIRESLLNEFFTRMSDEERTIVYQQVGFSPGQVYDTSLYESYSKLQQQQLQMLANDALGGQRKRGLRGLVNGLFRKNEGFYDRASQLTGKLGIQGGSYLADLVVPGLGASVRGGLQTLRMIGMGRVADSIERNIGKGLIIAIGTAIVAEIAAMLLAAQSFLAQVGYFLGGQLFGTAGRLGGSLLGNYLAGTKLGSFFERTVGKGAQSLWNAVSGDNGRGGAINPELAPTTANLITPTVPTSTAITSRASQLLGTQAGQIFIATTGTIGAVTIVSFMTINGAFQTNLPTVDSAGEVSPFVTITKQAYDSADNAINQVNNFSEPATFRYKILIEPKDGYTLTIDDVTDKLTYTFTDTNQKREPTVRDKAAFGLTPEAPTKVLNPADDDTANDFWLIEYDQTIDPLSDASARNTIEIHFTATKTGEADATETATSGFKLCVGECPKNEGDGCWPAYGVILQEPYGSYSHSKVDAVDIAYSKLVTNGQSDEKTITSPISGQACFYVKETGIPAREERCGHVYGNHVVVASEDFALVYGHLHQPTSKYEYGSCYPIEAGEPIGVMGTSGCSDGVHLHYEVRLRVKGGDTFSSFTSAIPGQPGPVTTLLETLVPGEQIKLNSTIPDKCQPARP